MKTDFYTKTILTVIAACLSAIVLRDAPIVSTAHAQARYGTTYGAHPGLENSVDVNIVAVGGKSILYGAAVPVKAPAE